ncbi:MAG: glutamate-5-semialdehyde dehydrogenase [Candidatus Borkfalkiaceae bacterium]|nr:glutamate-5-semialdehyde dehydrogenase [Clostridia bacterium]MDY6224178.1 glutamate-5-semialdehyde dehydrogenase [Christensenellaceae bacterium]
MKETSVILQSAKRAAEEAFCLTTERKNAALEAMAEALIAAKNEILSANGKDVESARQSISDVMIDRLSLNESRIEAMAAGVRALIALPDPVGRVIERATRENGLIIEKVSVPFGVTAIIYESRPNVTSDAAALCFKSGNACVLRSGKEAFRTSFEVTKALRRGLKKCGENEDLIQILEDTSRESATALMKAEGYVDLLIPRGGKGLIKACVEQAKVPVIETGTGICHVYVDAAADLQKAVKIIENAKTSRPSVCNAEEVCLVHKNVAGTFLPLLYQTLVKNRLSEGKTAVELRCDKRASEILSGVCNGGDERYIKAAGAEDFDTEFLDYILAVGVVDDVRSAAEHIAKHSTHHSDAIVTEDKKAADYFAAAVDSAAVYVNASTRFTDGGEFGLGCEMGISTQKLHARGPMGLKELQTYKYVVRGNGQIR